MLQTTTDDRRTQINPRPCSRVGLWLTRQWSSTQLQLSQCSTLVCNTVVRATFKVNGKPPILGSRSPLTPWPIDLKFDMGDYVRHMTPHAKNGKNRPRRADPAKWWNVKVKCGLFFYRISCPPLETTFLHRSTPFLRQITCFCVDWFPRGVWSLKFFPF